MRCFVEDVLSLRWIVLYRRGVIASPLLSPFESTFMHAEIAEA
jgi:hypothetical protein